MYVSLSLARGDAAFGSPISARPKLSQRVYMYIFVYIYIYIYIYIY